MKYFFAVMLLAFFATININAQENVKDDKEESKKIKMAKTMLDSYAEKTGGRSNYEKIETLHVIGKRDVVDPSRNIKEDFEFWWKAPNLFYAVFKYPTGKVISAYDGTTAWGHNPYMGYDFPIKVRLEDLVFVKNALEQLIPIVIDYDKSKLKVKFEDEFELKNGKDYNKVRLTFADNRQQDIYLGKEDNMLYKIERRDIDYMNQNIDFDLLFEEWQVINDIKFPKLVKELNDGKAMIDYYYNTIEVNVPVDVTKWAFPTPEKDTTETKSGN